MPTNLIMPIILGALLFIMFSFSNKKRKQMEEDNKKQQQSLAPGVQIMTIGRIVATVEEVSDQYLRVNTGNNSIVIAKEAVLKILNENVDLYSNQNNSVNNVNESNVMLEIMYPNTKTSKREEYGF